MAPPPGPRILACGDAALAVEFGETIDPALNAQVLALDGALAGCPGLIETVPTYRSLLVHYDPVEIGFAELSGRIRSLLGAAAPHRSPGRLWRIPVAYGGPHGIDLDETAQAHGIGPDELIARHAAPTYRVYMIGFLPGFAYLGGLDPSIALPRRTVPRLKTPPGTISIGGVQALVASIEAPSGWHLLGRTPVRTFMPGRDPVFLLGPGDRVRFDPIPAEAFEALEAQAAGGAIVAELLEVSAT
jgi:KipI family sensor histidine kinase inhibitor